MKPRKIKFLFVLTVCLSVCYYSAEQLLYSTIWEHRSSRVSRSKAAASGISNYYSLKTNYSTGDLFSRLQSEVPNIPFEWLNESEDRRGVETPKVNAKPDVEAAAGAVDHLIIPVGECGRKPHLKDLMINNNVWQRFIQPSITMFLYSAHLDVRILNPSPAIRIFTTISKPEVDAVEYPYCQIWLSNTSHPATVKATNFRFTGWDGLWNKTDKSIMNTPHMFDCPLPFQADNMGTIEAVSLVSSPCDPASNALKVFHGELNGKSEEEIEDQKRGKIAFCVKGLAFPLTDMSWPLVEWMEVTKQLKVDKVFMYYLQLQPKTLKALETYVQEGFLELIHFPLSGDQPNGWNHQYLYFNEQFESHVRHEKVAQHDCFYRNMYNYEYISPIDPDEVIVPQKDYSLPELIDRMSGLVDLSTVGSLSFNQSYFFTNHFPRELTSEEKVPDYFPIMKHFFRSEYSLIKQRKSLSRTSKVLMMSTHRPLRCFPDEDCYNHMVDESIGLLHHYRSSCVAAVNPDYCKEHFWNHMIEDKRLWWMKHLVMQKTAALMKAVEQPRR